MEKINDGGPAFPATWNPETGQMIEQVMTLRDYFAAKAMQGMCADPEFTIDIDIDIDGDVIGIKRAQTAYFIADAMLAAREQK